MGKAALQADLNRCLGKLSEVNGKLGKLRAALSNLQGVSTAIEYVLVSAENIKSNYHLAGHPYDEEAQTEKTTVDKVVEKYDEYKQNMISRLSSKISSLESEAASLRSGINMLSQAIARAKED